MVLMPLLHDLRSHNQTELSAQNIILDVIVMFQQFFCRLKVGLFDRIHNALLSLPHKIIFLKQKVLITITTDAKSRQNPIAKFFIWKSFSSFYSSNHTKRTNPLAQGLQCNILYSPSLPHKCRKIPQIECLQFIVFFTDSHITHILYITI